MENPCKARFRCLGPDTFVGLTTVTCSDLGDACCQGVGCRQGKVEKCPGHEVCSPDKLNDEKDPCETKPGQVVDAKHPLILDVPGGTGELVFQARVTAWYSDFAASGHAGVALRVTGPDGPPRYMAIPGGIPDVPVTITLGGAGPGRVRVEVDKELGPDPRPVLWVKDAEVLVLGPRDKRFLTYSRVPYFMGDAGRFVSDVPLALTAKQDKTGQVAYTLFYSNEDSGYGLIPPLMLAVWGRTLDIEWAVTVQDAQAKKATYQSEDHGTKIFDGKWIGTHPVMFIANAHGTFSDSGTGTVLFAPGTWSKPVQAPREVFLDSRGWMVQTSDKELFREKKLVGSTDKPTKLQVPDLRRVLYIDIDASPSGNKLNLELQVGNEKSVLDAGFGVRAMLDSSGPKRIAIPFPKGATREKLRKTGILSACIGKKGTGTAVIHGLTAFVLDDRFDRDEAAVFRVTRDIAIDSTDCKVLGRGR